MNNDFHLISRYKQAKHEDLGGGRGPGVDDCGVGQAYEGYDCSHLCRQGQQNLGVRGALETLFFGQMMPFVAKRYHFRTKDEFLVPAEDIESTAVDD